MGTTFEPAGGYSAKSKPHVFVISDIRLFREGLSVLLSRNAALRVVGSAAPGEIGGGMERSGADIVLLDATLVDLPGCVRRMRDMVDGIKVVAGSLGEADRGLITRAPA